MDKDIAHQRAYLLKQMRIIKHTAHVLKCLDSSTAKDIGNDLKKLADAALDYCKLPKQEKPSKG